MSMDISEFYQTFFDEADELLDEMEHLLVGLVLEAPDSEQLNAIFRAAHSIKGGAGTFGFTCLQETTHLLENLLDRARQGEMPLDRPTVDVFLEARDTLKDQINAYRDHSEPDAKAFERISATLKMIAEQAGLASASVDAESAAPAATTPVQVERHATDRPSRTQAGTDQTVIAENLIVTVRAVGEKDSQSLAGELGLLGDIVSREYAQEVLTVRLLSTETEADIEAVLCFLVDAGQLSIIREEAAPKTVAPDPSAPVRKTAAAQEQAKGGDEVRARHAQSNKESGSLRVSTEKIDQIINLVGELVITQSMLEQTSAGLDVETCGTLVEGMGQLQRNARDLQEAILSIRMMPMDYAFSRFPRLVRDLSSKLGKQVTLNTEGAATELDKGMIEHIMDPLTHLVRNSLDHGIETPDVRVAVGKSAVGTLTLAAQHQGGNILIEITDDGAGLSRERILAKATENGLAVPENMLDDDVWQLIFAPGFSTAAAVTDVSGRGVGMDVVKSNIQKLGGYVDVRSTAGQGTTISIALPLTLAIMDGMLVQVGAEVFIMPLGAIMESMQIREENINMVTGREPVLHVRGEYLALVELHRIFNVPNAETDMKNGIVMVLQSEGRRFAVLVDKLLGQNQVVVKNLETNYRKVPGISTATILGDGSVALILDVVALSRSSQKRGYEARHGPVREQQLQEEVMS